MHYNDISGAQTSKVSVFGEKKQYHKTIRFLAFFSIFSLVVFGATSFFIFAA